MIGFITILFEDGSTIETIDEYSITHSENSFYKIVFPASVNVMKYRSICHINNLTSIIFESDEVTLEEDSIRMSLNNYCCIEFPNAKKSFLIVTFLKVMLFE